MSTKTFAERVKRLNAKQLRQSLEALGKTPLIKGASKQEMRRLICTLCGEIYE